MGPVRTPPRKPRPPSCSLDAGTPGLASWVSLALLAMVTGVSQACGALRERVLDPKAGGVPLDFVEVDFRARNRPEDLVSSPWGLLGPHMETASTCFGRTSPAGRLLSATADAHTAFSSTMARLSPLPAGIKPIPDAETLVRANARFVDAKKQAIPFGKSHEATAESELFTRSVGPWKEGDGWLRERLAKGLSGGNGATGTGVEGGVTLNRTRLRSFYARSLEPGGGYQWLVLCAQVEATFASGATQDFTWPLYQALETGTLGSSTVQSVSLRDALETTAEENTLRSRAETFAAISVRQENRLRVETLASVSASTSAGISSSEFSKLSSVAFRESAQVFLNRFAGAASGTDANRTTLAVASFQHGLGKSVWESAPGTTGGRPEGIRYLNSACGPLRKDEDPAFAPGGIHAVEATAAKAAAQELAARTALLPEETRKTGEAVCAALAAENRLAREE